MDQEHIRNIVITAIFSNDSLLDKLTLKGGNALELQGINVRSSQDIDFSIAEGVEFDRQEYEPLLKKSLTEGFSEIGYQVINFKFEIRPRHKNKLVEKYNQQTDFQELVWGGYHIRFSIIQKGKYEALKKSHVQNIGAHAETTWENKKDIEIDLSKDEYTKPRDEQELDGYTIYLYTPIMIIYEKVRASCQQLPQYKIGSHKVRARDLFDIYELLSYTPGLRGQILDKQNIYILRNMFNLKQVDLQLLTQLSTYKDELAQDYKNNVLPQVRKNEDKQNFDFIFDFSEQLFENIYKLTLHSS